MVVTEQVGRSLAARMSEADRASGCGVPCELYGMLAASAVDGAKAALNKF
jgi:hypothetical protein